MSDFPRDAGSPAPLKTRKKRYSFRAGDDMILLRTALDDLDIFSFSPGRRTNAWEGITLTLNRQGIAATTHSLRCRMKRIVATFKEEVAEGKQTTGKFML